MKTECEMPVEQLQCVSLKCEATTLYIVIPDTWEVC